MKAICTQMDVSEHCPDCGALLVAVPGGSVCACCGFEHDDPQDGVTFSLTSLPGRWGEGARFRFMDEAA